MYLLETARQHGVSQVLFSSSLGAYGMDLSDDAVLGDKTLQRPISFYGVTKLFSEGAGRFYRRKYGLDYRGIHYPAIVGPGIRAAGFVTYTSAMIEKSASGEPYTILISPNTRVPIVYVEDAARALILLSRAPKENIKTVNYFINGLTPVPSAAEMVEAVNRRFPDAQIDFKPRPDWDAVLKLSARPVEDTSAREEWGWQPLQDTWDKVIEAYLAALQK
jgi:nucleoside-diphosphate-sugar epimerase